MGAQRPPESDVYLEFEAEVGVVEVEDVRLGNEAVLEWVAAKLVVRCLSLRREVMLSKPNDLLGQSNCMHWGSIPPNSRIAGRKETTFRIRSWSYVAKGKPASVGNKAMNASLYFIYPRRARAWNSVLPVPLGRNDDSYDDRTGLCYLKRSKGGIPTLPNRRVT